jgi:hypothetical protein
MSHTVEYFRFSDKKPADGQEIWYVYHSRFYGSIEILFGKAEWQWEEVDENGQTGSAVIYNGEDPSEMVEGYTLSVFIAGFNGDLDNVMWCPADAFDKMFD